MADNDTPLEGPLSIDDVLDSIEDRQEATPSEDDTDAPIEAQADDTEDEAEEAETEEDEATSDEQDEPDTDEGGPDVYDAEEYGEVAVLLKDGTQTTIADLVKGNLRQADYSRKTDDVSKARKEMEEREAALVDRERQLNEQIANAGDVEPDWEKLFEEDPLGAPLKQIQWQKEQKKKQEARERAEADQAEQLEKFRAMTAQKAFDVFPKWAEGTAFKDGAQARLQAALDAGFTQQEYEATPDFRIAVVLEKAALWDASQKKSSAALKKISKAKKVLKPSTSTSKADKANAERVAKAKRRDKPMSLNEYLDTYHLKTG